MKLLMNLMLIFTLGFLVISCDDETNPSILTTEKASKKATNLVSGTVTSVEVDSTGAPYWEVKITTDSGGEVEVKFDQATGNLLEIEGDVGPFDYEVTPGMGLIPFSEARAELFAEYVDAEIIEWELEQDLEGNWVYEFDIIFNQDEISVKIDAETGNIIT